MDRMDANEALSSLAIRWERLLFSLEKAAKTLAAFKDRDGDLSSSLLSIRDFGSSLLSPRVVQHKNSLVRLVAAVCAVELCRVFGSKVVFLPLETRQTLVRLFIGQLDFRETTRDEGSVIYRRRLWELLARSGAMAICSSHGEQLLTAVFDCAGYLNQSPSLANAAVKIVIDFVQETQCYQCSIDSALILHQCSIDSAKALDVDVPARMKAIGPDLVAADAGAMEEAEKYQERKESDQVLDIRIALAAQQLALEILANLCCNNDSSDDGGSFPSESDSEVDGVEEEQSGSGFESMALSMSVDSVEAVVSHCLPEKTLGKCRFADPAVYELLGAHKLGQTLVQKLNTVQSRALVALHNMLSVLDSDELSRPDSLDSLWPSLFNLATGVSEKGPSRSDEEFLEAVTGVMRSLAKRLQSTGHKCVEPEQIIRIASVCPTVAFPSVRANVVGLLGVLGTSLAQRPDAAELLTVVGSALCKAVSSDTDLWVVVEALDAIFDVFGGDGDIVLPTVKFLGLLPQLERVASGLKKRIASKRKSLGARLPVAENAWTNLPRFITYLRKGIK
ncbi:HEAT repeat-containing protein 3-like [Oscarella lobularis]|uniref:HEAT repeat-containing protein 3-like n=1 Tax=Oscarella lobularis TaxID=121494 RepID=UPI0033131A53